MENMVSETFWRGKKILMTGHTGFKGGWLSLWLQAMGAELVGYSLPSVTKPSLFDLGQIADGMTSVIGDIRDYESFFNVVKTHSPEIVIHMAAQPLVRYSYREPVETYATNVMGTVHVLEAARQVSDVKVVVNVTTDKCYENKGWHWGYREDDRLGGFDPYSNSKSCSELVTAAYRNSYFHSGQVAVASARAGNVIGGGDWSEDRLIPDIIRACMNQDAVMIRHPNALRPWQHVLQPLSGYLLLIQRLYESPTNYNESWNFGPDESDVKPVSWIADYIGKLWNNSKAWERDEAKHPHEAAILRLECAKAKAKLGWSPKWDLAKGLEETVAWYQAYQAGSNMRDMTLAQINSFTGKPRNVGFIKQIMR